MREGFSGKTFWYFKIWRVLFFYGECGTKQSGVLFSLRSHYLNRRFDVMISKYD